MNMNDDTLDDFDDSDPEADISDLFPFRDCERAYLETIEDTVRKRLRLLPPDELRRASLFLFALGRLPYSTPGLALDFGLVNRGEWGMEYVSVEISGVAFRLSKGGSVYTEGVGSDSYSEAVLELETGGYREGNSEDIPDWIAAFEAFDGRVTIEDIDTALDLDMTEEAPDDGWERLARYWEERD
jgi:hypothetical protein